MTIFALFSLPGWLFAKVAYSYTHLSTSLAIAGNVGTALLTGVSYGPLDEAIQEKANGG